jgi:Lipocalin-like domain
MGRRLILAITATLLVVIAITSNALAQPARLKDAIVGSWLLVSLSATRPDGAVVMPYGPHPVGTMSFSQSGRFVIVLINPDIPKYASNDRGKPTPAEAMAIAAGSNALRAAPSTVRPAPSPCISRPAAIPMTMARTRSGWSNRSATPGWFSPSRHRQTAAPRPSWS